MSILQSGHGGGGRLSSNLISAIAERFTSRNILPPEMEDCALLSSRQGISLDGFTVTPRFFPGGSLGKLAVCGSLNDVAVRGMRPESLLLGIIAEEGLEEEELLEHMDQAAEICAREEVRLLGGDTKVLPRGALDGLFITTCAVGSSVCPSPPGMSLLQPGDALLLTGSPGRHGACIAACRYNLDIPDLQSDCAPLWSLLEPLFGMEGFRCARDATRGGTGTVLCEWAEGRKVGILLEEEALPRDERVESLGDLLGLDPLYMACEGTAVVATAPEDAEKCLELLKRHPLGKDAAIIGKISEEHPGIVGLRTSLGGVRILDMPVGDPLPRIC
ncbi:MAG TPA: hydrogenase expression/formation protein HypE [Synergistaceae bacterium]|nr:hydrogenase expression/formation protein HypE [Synergistaceae bacterium]HPQ38058.1 hydrogenase expression/formation protein HypE [Synergistaceae bacterium]